jgi:quinol monooxygenase YgiN
MYGTVAKMRIKPGAEDQLRAQMEEIETLDVPGFVSSTVYRMDDDANEMYLAVVFDSRETYHANAQSPEQDARYRKMLELLEGEPEWHDGEILYSG